jgi:ABC-2 type transport system permease protein
VLFSHFVLGAAFPRLFWVLLILLLSVVFNQLLGTIILLASKGPKLANMVTTIYGSIAPMLAGLYFPLPQNALFRYIRLYGTPMNLANTVSISVLDGTLMQSLVPLLILLSLTVLLFILLKPMAGRVRV